MLIKLRRSQSILEYAILIAIVIGAIVIMQVYVKRGISGRIKDSSDRISGGQSFAAGHTATLESSSLDTSKGKRVIQERTATGGSDGVGTAVADKMGVKTDTGIGTDTFETGKNAYSMSKTAGGATVSNSAAASDSIDQEAFRGDDIKNLADSSKVATSGDFGVSSAQ